jgi:hypothetical protein
MAPGGVQGQGQLGEIQHLGVEPSPLGAGGEALGQEKVLPMAGGDYKQVGTHPRAPALMAF